MANLEGKEYMFLSPSRVREPQVFGGVRNDLRWIGNSIAYDSPSDVPGHVLGSVVFIADLPLSAAADTVTLPLVAHQQWNRSFAPAYEETSPADSAPSK